jgi:RNA polymerase sigma-70 factor (ECF subfamily)
MSCAKSIQPGITALFTPCTVAYARAMEQVHDDGALMMRYRAGDSRAFEMLYRRHNDALYRYLLRLCYDRDITEDIFQDAWVKIVRTRDSYRPSAGFRTFLFHVAHNCFIDYLRRNRRHLAEVRLDPDTHPNAANDPEQNTEQELARRQLEKALKTLPQEQREVFLLHQEGHLSVGQIATVTGVNRETAKSRLRYAVRKLRAAIDENDRSGDAGARSGDGFIDPKLEAL